MCAASERIAGFGCAAANFSKNLTCLHGGEPLGRPENLSVRGNLKVKR